MRLIVATRGRSPARILTIAANPSAPGECPLVILIDHDRECREILAGAIRDHRRGRSGGKLRPKARCRHFSLASTNVGFA